MWVPVGIFLLMTLPIVGVVEEVVANVECHSIQAVIIGIGWIYQTIVSLLK